MSDEAKKEDGSENGRADSDAAETSPPTPDDHAAEVNGGPHQAVEPRIFGEDPLDEQQSIELIESAHDLPGHYPVVVIAARDEVFRALLLATVEFEQDGDPFTITDRESSKGNYISYRVELYVENGRDALDRKAVLASLTGVVTIL